MKKYVRTKDGIYKVVADEKNIIYKDTNMIAIYDHKIYQVRDIHMNEIIKQADTIEELCDCYSHETFTVIDVAVARSWKLHNKEREIFGCIKTDKGLMYATKMDNEGELELI